MPKLDILNQLGENVGQIELSDYVFGITPHQQALYDVVKAQRAAKRQGTHKVKVRSEVSGGGKKPWRQKGTGRARHGSTRSPIWRGGGVVFGPTKKTYTVKVNKKVRNLAFRSALSAFREQERLTILNELVSENGKTKDFQAMLNTLNLYGKTLFISDEFEGKELKAGRNIKAVSFASAKHVSVYDILDSKNLVITENAVKILEEALGND